MSVITVNLNLTTSTVPEGSNLYFTEARVRSTVLTGLNITGGAVVATDTLITAMGKLQNQVNGLVGGVTYQSTWNATTNSPALASGVGTKGYYYVVSVAGSTNLDGITDWKLGDWAIYNGAAWEKIDNTDAVTSVNGYTGAVSLVTTDISEGTNLYFTTARAQAAITGTSNRITVSSGVVDISATYVGQASITTLGTITTGTLGSGTKILVGSDTTGDMYYNGGSGAITRLASVATGSLLASGGAGVAPAWSASPTLTTSLTTPLLIGGTTTTSTLTFKTTTGNATTGSDFIWQGGNNGATELMRMLSSGVLLIGNNASIASATPQIEVARAGAGGSTYNGISIINNNTTGTRAGIFGFYKARASTLSGRTALSNTDDIAFINGYSADGTNYQNTVQINFRADGTQSSSSLPTAIIFSVTASSSTGHSEVWRISNTGRLSNTAAAGTAYIHLKAGTATASTAPLKFTSGTNLTSAEDGAVEYDGTNLWFTPSATTRKRVAYRDPLVSTEASNSSPTPNVSNADFHTVTALAANATFGAPTGTAANGQKLMIRIKDNGTPRTLAWNAAYRAGTTLALPVITTTSKTMYVLFIYNSTDAVWDLLSVTDGY